MEIHAPLNRGMGEMRRKWDGLCFAWKYHMSLGKKGM